MDIGTGDHLPIAQKPYMLPLKQSQWVYEVLKMLEKTGIISRNVSPLFAPIVIVPKKAQSGKISWKHLFIDYCALNTFYHKL